MAPKIKILSVFSKIDSTTIPLENFSRVNSENFDKYIFVLHQSQADAEAFIKYAYPESHISTFSAFSFKANNDSFVTLANLINQIKPDIVHSHHTLAALQTSILKFFFDFSLLITAHNNYSHYSFLQRWSYGFSYFASDKLICNSENTLRNLPFFVSERKTVIIYNGVDFSKVDAALEISQVKTAQVETGDVIIGSICRMVPFKDIKTLIRGFDYLINNLCGLGVKLVLVGDGPARDSLELLVNDLHLDSLVNFTGFLPRQDAYQELSKMDIFVVSSLWEGFCNAMVEAASAGKVIVTTDIEPLPEVIGRDNALLFPARDYRKLAYLLQDLLQNPFKRKVLGDKAKSFVRSRYSIENSAQSYEFVYKQLIIK